MRVINIHLKFSSQIFLQQNLPSDLRCLNGFELIEVRVSLLITDMIEATRNSRKCTELFSKSNDNCSK